MEWIGAGRHLFVRWWVLAFFRSWNSEGLLLLRSKLFLLSPAPIHTNTRGGDQNMQGIGCYALKISMIEKTPTPHHRKNAALPYHHDLEDDEQAQKMITTFARSAK